MRNGIRSSEIAIRIYMSNPIKHTHKNNTPKPTKQNTSKSTHENRSFHRKKSCERNRHASGYYPGNKNSVQVRLRCCAGVASPATFLFARGPDGLRPLVLYPRSNPHPGQTLNPMHRSVPCAFLPPTPAVKPIHLCFFPSLKAKAEFCAFVMARSSKQRNTCFEITCPDIRV